MDDDWGEELEEAEWAAMCRAYGMYVPMWTPEQRKVLLLRSCAALNAELSALVANAIADPSQTDPRNWRF